MILGKEIRWVALESQREREKLFQDYLRERTRKEETRRRKERQVNLTALKKYLEACKWLKVDTSWCRVCAQLEGVPEFENCYRSDRLNAFKEIIRMLEGHEKECRGAEKRARIRSERKNRDEFKSLVKTHVQEGLITAKMRWR